MNTSTCNRCGEEICWFKDQNGQSTAIEAGSIELGDEQLESHHIIHWKVCTGRRQAKLFQGSKRKER